MTYKSQIYFVPSTYAFCDQQNCQACWFPGFHSISVKTSCNPYHRTGELSTKHNTVSDGQNSSPIKDRIWHTVSELPSFRPDLRDSLRSVVSAVYVRSLQGAGLYRPNYWIIRLIKKPTRPGGKMLACRLCACWRGQKIQVHPQATPARIPRRVYVAEWKVVRVPKVLVFITYNLPHLTPSPDGRIDSSVRLHINLHSVEQTFVLCVKIT